MNYSIVYNSTSNVIRGLVFRFPSGFVHPCSESNCKPSFVFHTDTKSIHDALEINELEVNGVNSISFGFKAAMHLEGRYLLDIYMPQNSLAYIENNSPTNLVIENGILTSAEDTSVDIETSGVGDIYITDETLQLEKLTLGSLGPGSIQLDMSSTLKASTFNVHASASGTIAVSASGIISNDIFAKTEGTGDLFLAATSDGIRTTTLKSISTGSGSINYYNTGSCKSQTIKVDGNGSTFSDAIECHDVVVSSSSSGYVYVTASNSLQSTRTGSGKVYNVGIAPHISSGEFENTIDGHVNRYTRKPIPKHSPSRVNITFEADAIPIIIAPPQGGNSGSQSTDSELAAPKPTPSCHSTKKLATTIGIVVGMVYIVCLG